MALPARQKALRRVLRENPCSLRRLAEAAGVPHSNLREARDGVRPVSEGLATNVVVALRRWAEKLNALADELEATL